MDALLIAQSLVGILTSITTQAVKRKDAGMLENVLLTGGVTFGGVQVANALGYNTGIPIPIIAAYAFHGLVGSLTPMQALKFGTIDRLFEGVGKAFGSISSNK